MRVLLLAPLLVALLAGCLSSQDAPLDDIQSEDGAEALGPVVKLHEERFEGVAPAADPGIGAVQTFIPVPVPDGATRVLVTYNSTYTGLWPSYGVLFDAAGTERASSADACDAPLAPGALASYSCAFEVQRSVDAGEWTFRLAWQVGEVAEEYSVDVVVWGRA